MALTDKLTAIADAIRSKTGKTATMTIEEMSSEIASISIGKSNNGLCEPRVCSIDVIVELKEE